jgi:glycopeptide antibiotics resistance protein
MICTIPLGVVILFQMIRCLSKLNFKTDVAPAKSVSGTFCTTSLDGVVNLLN